LTVSDPLRVPYAPRRGAKPPCPGPHTLTPTTKLDGRDHTIAEAWELQGHSGQAGVVRLVPEALDDRLAPVTLDSVHEREEAERAALAAYLDGFGQ
jgi:hypothetical protein